MKLYMYMCISLSVSLSTYIYIYMYICTHISLYMCIHDAVGFIVSSTCKPRKVLYVDLNVKDGQMAVLWMSASNFTKYRSSPSIAALPTPLD